MGPALADPEQAYEVACLFSRAAASRFWADPEDLTRAAVALAASAVGIGQLSGSTSTDLDLDPLRVNGWIGHVETALLPDVLAGHDERRVTPQVSADLRTAWTQFNRDSKAAKSAPTST